MIKRSEFIGKLKKPFPWSGSKVRVAPVIMDLLHGDGWANQHIEPFVGSNACLLDTSLDGVKVILNDFDGKITNLWRCLKYKPDQLANLVTGVVNTINITGWDFAIQNGYDAMLDRLHADIEYCDVKLGAYYLDLMANWIGDNVGNCKGPWNQVMDDGYMIMAKNTGTGDRGVICQQTHLTRDMGVSCKQAQFTSDIGVRCQQAQFTGDRGVSCKQSSFTSDRGISCQQTHFASDRGVSCQQSSFTPWFTAISDRLSNAKITSHDWIKIMNIKNIKNNRTSIMLDPPYNAAGNNGGGVEYINNNNNVVSDDVMNWIITNTEDLKGTRIVVCGRGYEHDALLDHGFTKIVGKNIKSLNKKLADEFTQEFLWYKPNC